MPGNLITTSGVTLEAAFDYDLVRVTSSGNCLLIRGNASGRIGRIELTNTSGSGDCLIVANKTGSGRVDLGLPTPGMLGGGFFHQPTKSGTSHNDTYQARGGNHIHTWDCVFKGPNYETGVNSSQGVLFQNSGQGFSGPDDQVCHRCVWTGRFSNPVNWGPGSNCGIIDCYVIGDVTGNYVAGALIGKSGHTNPIDQGNTINTGQNHPVVSYAYANLEVPWLNSGGGTFSRTAQREIIVVRSSLKGVTRSRTAQRDHSESHQVILSGGGNDIVRPRQADRLADIIRSRTVTKDLARTADRLPDVTRQANVGQVTYTQWTTAWTSTEVNAGCTVTIGQNNRVTAFTNQASTGDISRALLADTQYFPGDYVKGRLRFRITGKMNVFGQSQSIFALKGGAPTNIRFAFDGAGDRLTAVLRHMGGGATELVVPDLLGTSPVIGQTYLLEWKLDRSTTATQFYEIKVDGVVVATGTPAAASAVETITSMFAGFNDAGNVDGVVLGVTVDLWDIVLANADVPLPSEPASGGPIEGEGSAVPEAVLGGQANLVGSGSI